LALRDHLSCPYYREIFYKKTVHANIIGNLEKMGPVCISVQKEVSKDEHGEQIYNVLIRSKAEDQLIQLPTRYVTKKKRERFARSEYLLSGLKKMMKGVMNQKDLYVIYDEKSHQCFATLESKLVSNCSKFGVIYAKDGQDETAMYNNVNGSVDFEQFLDLMGTKIDMLGWTKYRGDLSARASQKSVYTEYRGHNIMFHVSTYIPYMAVTDATHQQWDRKRFIGNDIVVIVYYEGKTPLLPSTFVSNFNHVFCIVQKQSDGENYKVDITTKAGVATSLPYIPDRGLVHKNELKSFLLTKLINAERCSMSAPQFAKYTQRTREELFKNLQKDFPKKKVKVKRGMKDQVHQCYMAVEL